MTTCILRTFTLGFAFAVTLAAGSARANLVINGDFEITNGWGAPGTMDFPSGWISEKSKPNAADQQNGGNQISGTTSAYIPGGADQRISQIFEADTDPEWTFEFDFAVEDPGDSAARILDLAIQFAGSLTSRLYIRLNGDGDLQCHSGTWTTISGLAGAIAFDDDVQVDPLVHHLKLDAYLAENSADSFYNVTISRAGQADKVASDVKLFNSNPPDDTFDISTLTFYSTTAGTFDYLIDNVFITGEPPVYTPGDADKNGVVDESDAAILAANWLQASDTSGDPWGDGDFNGDGVVNDIDATLLASNWQATTSASYASVPEPTVAAMLIFALVTLLAYRRRSS